MCATEIVFRHKNKRWPGSKKYDKLLNFNGLSRCPLDCSPVIRHVYGTNWLDIERTRSATPCVSTHFARSRAKYHFALRSERPHSATRKRQSVRQPPYGLLTVAREYRRFGFGRRNQIKRTTHKAWFFCGDRVGVVTPCD